MNRTDPNEIINSIEDEWISNNLPVDDLRYYAQIIINLMTVAEMAIQLLTEYDYGTKVSESNARYKLRKALAAAGYEQ